MKTSASLSPRDLKPVLAPLARANAAFVRAHPGESGDRQPVHTVYGGAHLFRADTCRKLGVVALKSLEEFAPDFSAFAKALGLREPGTNLDAIDDDELLLKSLRPGRFAETVHGRVVEKLKREPVEDYRIDFEDGYGNRPDAEEDGHARTCAEEVAAGAAAGTLSPFIGIRIKTLSKELHSRSLRTLDIFVTTMVRKAGRLVPGFVVTVPKVVIPEQVAAVAKVCSLLEKKLRLTAGSLKIELMIETPQSILSPSGNSALRSLVAAAEGRCTGAHFGTYDYTALAGITAAHQHMLHPACDFAKDVMQVALAQTGVRLSDGATNIMPVGPHRAEAGKALSAEQARENKAAVHRAWRLHFEHARHSLVHGYYQGWDLHPAQLPTRYAAVYSFFLEGLEPASARLRNFVEKAAQATLVGDVFDDAATGQGLLNYFLRGLNCGAITLDEARQTGLTLEEFQGRSFLKILDNRRKS